MCPSKDKLVNLAIAILQEEGPMTINQLLARLAGHATKRCSQCGGLMNHKTHGIRITPMRLLRLLEYRALPLRLNKVGRDPSGACVWGVSRDGKP